MTGLVRKHTIRRMAALLAAALLATGCGGGGGAGGGGGGVGGGAVATYGNTTLPGRMLVNSLGGSGAAAVFDLTTGQRVVLPRSGSNPDGDSWSAGASVSTIVRTNQGAAQTEVAFFDATSLAAAKPSLRISNSLSTPMLSFDGTQLLSFWYDQSSGESILDKRFSVFNAASGAVVERGSQLDGASVIGNAAAWLPDGRYVYLAADKSLYRSSPTSTTWQRIAVLALPDNASPNTVRSSLAVSPDGTRIAFSWAETRGVSQDMNLWVVGSDGSGLRRLTQAPDAASPLDFVHGSPAWSPDGQWVAGVLYMSGSTVAPVFPDVPFLGARIVSTTGCIDQVFVVGATASAVALTWPTFDAAHGVKVVAPSGTAGQWLSSCGGEIAWLR